MKIYRYCLTCGSKFYSRPSKIKDGRGKYCSRGCWIKGKITKIQRTCIVCANTFYSPFHRVKDGHGKYCSRACFEIGRIKQKNTVCIECGKLFKQTPAELKKGSKFCSRKCWINANMGSKSHRWKGGITPIYAQVRGSDKYFTWRKEVFARDNYTCQKCGDSKGGNLHAHHVKRFSVILNDIKQKFPLLSISNMAFTTKELWDVSNGVTLCKECHKKEHKKQ